MLVLPLPLPLAGVVLMQVLAAISAVLVQVPQVGWRRAATSTRTHTHVGSIAHRVVATVAVVIIGTMATPRIYLAIVMVRTNWIWTASGESSRTVLRTAA